MSVLSDAQIADVASKAGFKGSALVIAVAIALAESSGRTDAVNSLGCVGLWQIYQKVHPQWTTAQLKNPAVNAQAAYTISNAGRNWKPWETFTNGAYKRYIDRAQKAVQGSFYNGGDRPPNVSNPPGDSKIEQTVKSINTLKDPKTWVAVLLVLVGIVVIFIAVIKLSGPDLAKGAINLLPEGKIADLIKVVK